MEPRIVQRPALDAIGLAGHFTPSTASRIPELWERFAHGPMDAVPHRRASKSRLAEVTLGYFDGDARCDVKIGDTIYSGGTTVRLFSVGTLSGGTLAR